MARDAEFLFGSGCEVRHGNRRRGGHHALSRRDRLHRRSSHTQGDLVHPKRRGGSAETYVYVAAEVPGTGADRDFMLLCFTENLTLLWTSRWSYQPVEGWDGDDVPIAMAVDRPQGNSGPNFDPIVVVTGTTTSPTGGTDIATVRFNGRNGKTIWSRVFDGPTHQADRPVGVVLHRYQLSPEQGIVKAYVAGTTTTSGGFSRYVLLRTQCIDLPPTEDPIYYPNPNVPHDQRRWIATAMCRPVEILFDGGPVPVDTECPLGVYITGYSEVWQSGTATMADWETVKYCDGTLQTDWTELPLFPPPPACAVPPGVYDGPAHLNDYPTAIYAARYDGTTHGNPPRRQLVWVAGTSQVSANEHRTVVLQYNDLLDVMGKDWKAHIAATPGVAGADAIVPMAMYADRETTENGAYGDGLGDVMICLRRANGNGNYDWETRKYRSDVPGGVPPALCEIAVAEKPTQPPWTIAYPISGTSGNDAPSAVIGFINTQPGRVSTRHSIYAIGSIFNLANPASGVDTGLVKYQEIWP
ncbi:MAG: hypothetical protein JNM80_00050 [Phycisphaerae bacterium]|nr:hypothetical protein [Phycisphaerae bacterium]